MPDETTTPSSVRIAIVMHAREAKRERATGTWITRVCDGSSLYTYGERERLTDLSHLHQGGRRVLVLFPREGAPLLTRELVIRDPRPITLVVPDGTWRSARRAILRVPGLQEAEVVRLAEDDLDTVEATARALEILETDELAAGFRRKVAALTSSLPNGARRALHSAAGRENVLPADPTRDALPILFEDEFLVAVNKSSGTIVHRGWANDERPALQILRDQLGKRVHAVHRLDRATSGVLLFAKSPEVTRDMQAQFESGAVEKRYLAVCRGHQLQHQRLEHPLVNEKGGPYLSAITNFRLLGAFERYGLVEARPETGRTHQIRKHLKHLSHPIIGDVRYGKGEHNRIFRERFGFHRLALHCESLRFVHPRSGESLAIVAPLPEDMRRLVELFGSE